MESVSARVEGEPMVATILSVLLTCFGGPTAETMYAASVTPKGGTLVVQEPGDALTIETRACIGYTVPGSKDAKVEAAQGETFVARCMVDGEVIYEGDAVGLWFDEGAAIWKGADGITWVSTAGCQFRRP